MNATSRSSVDYRRAPFESPTAVTHPGFVCACGDEPAFMVSASVPLVWTSAPEPVCIGCMPAVNGLIERFAAGDRRLVAHVRRWS